MIGEIILEIGPKRGPKLNDLRFTRAVIASSLLLAVWCVNGARAQERTFGGYDCTDDCSGHAAGYRWAEGKSITDESRCPLTGNRQSFYEGCQAYVEDPGRGADEDDDGNDVD